MFNKLYSMLLFLLLYAFVITTFIHIIVYRFGLYGLPLERNRFGAEMPEMFRGPTLATHPAVWSTPDQVPPAPTVPPHLQHFQLKDLLNMPPADAPGMYYSVLCLSHH